MLRKGPADRAWGVEVYESLDLHILRNVVCHAAFTCTITISGFLSMVTALLFKSPQRMEFCSLS